MKYDEKIFRSESFIPPMNSKSIVFTNGCFDILHPGHMDYISRCKEYGETLVIGLNSDSSIMRIKGKDRPINDFSFRSLMLSYIDVVDYIVEFDQDTPLELIKIIKPNILIKGGDYSIEKIIGSDFVNSYGGKVLTIPIIHDFSSSTIIRRIKEL